MKGRVLKDIPRLGLRCGEYAEIPDGEANGLIVSGHFDQKAVDQNKSKAIRERRPRKNDASS